jgi:hypothetical protein
MDLGTGPIGAGMLKANSASINHSISIELEPQRHCEAVSFENWLSSYRCRWRLQLAQCYLRAHAMSP